MALLLQSIRHYAKAHLGLALGAFLASAILTGSLVVGDSVRASLKKAAGQRLGTIQSAMVGGDRWFTQDLARRTDAVPAILLHGAVSESEGRARANAVQVLGVDEAFWKLAPSGRAPAHAANAVALNSSLARKLGVKVGDTVIVRLEAPSAISRDAPLSGSTNEEVTLRRKVAAVVQPEDFGRFQLTASQTGPDSVFVPLGDLQQALEKPAQVNLMLRSGAPIRGEASSSADEDVLRAWQATLEREATLEDYALKLGRPDGSSDTWQVTTERVFLDAALADRLLKGLPGAQGVLTYLVNGLSSGKSTSRTPYSMVTGVSGATFDAPAGSPEADDGAIVSQWLAEDLNLTPGDTFDIRYFTVGLGRELREQSATFKVSKVLPMNDSRVNRGWTPDFPGVSDVDNCRDWQPGIPVKLDAIRDKDEKYWDDFKGTPKAFISLKAAQRLWSNRFGSLTSIRFKAEDRGDEASLRRDLASRLKFSDVGLLPRDVRAEAAAAAKGSVDFGGLFIGLSLFLIAAALVFSALLFLFTLEKRASQVGLLLAIGWTPGQVRRAVLGEAGAVAMVGSVSGLLGGLDYTHLALAGLNSIWADATGGLILTYHAKGSTLAMAFISSMLAALVTLWWASRKMFRAQATHLLAGESWAADIQSPQSSGNAPSRGRGLLPWLAVIAATALAVAGSKASHPEAMAGMFFGAGFLLLLSGLLVVRRWLFLSGAAGPEAHGPRSLAAVGLKNVTRRPNRSLAVIGMMAGGIFLVIAVNAFRLSADADPTRRDSGTGGFALIGESTLPIYEDLNTPAASDAFALDEKLMSQARIVPFRVKEGDDASCLNLNRAQNPVLCAANPKLLSERGAFKFAEGTWTDLDGTQPEITAIADQATALWGLGKGVGDTLSYTDAGGTEFKIKLVGLLAGSVLQGRLIISEEAFLKKFPDTAGYRFFLVDAAPEVAVQVSEHLTRQLATRGLALEPTKTRLAAFLAVQNTYIGIFTVLGGLGVLLGTAGLGVLAARNILERRAEFGLMQALGFLPDALRRMVLSENVALLAAGLVLGLVSAALAVWPNVQQSGGALPLAFLLWLNTGILLFGISVCWLAARLALSGKLLDAVRRE